MSCLSRSSRGTCLNLLMDFLIFGAHVGGSNSLYLKGKFNKCFEGIS